MTITIEPIEARTLAEARMIDGSFVIESRLVLAAEGDVPSFTTVPLPPRTKRYEETDYAGYVGRRDRAAFLARADGRPAGLVALSKSWNGFACVDEILVDTAARKSGIGRALIDAAIAWARSRTLPGIMLETQTTNVAACRFYQRCGFVLGGWDRFLYQAIDPGTDEIALTWYLFFDQAGDGMGRPRSENKS
ncbi:MULTISPECIES: GNAT family N-acetyltransferase [unclassified Inquilinus]|uniref:GNAT family N-acetyltransferase n=1 Tax=unclassified Inquilinus TaxID=2645927 RepID=UPI003F932E7A